MFRDNLNQTLNLVDAAIAEMRGVLMNLSPTLLKEQGLEKSIKHLVHTMETSSGLKVEIVCPEPLPRWDEAIELNIYRIVQESITNVIKHAQATKLKIIMGKINDQIFSLEVLDDGQGFVYEDSYHGIGLTSMQERAEMIGAKLEINSISGKGTNIVLEVPLEKNKGVNC